jgi:peptidoglycan/LPS O-acetylase OafA/YrhL
MIGLYAILRPWSYDRSWRRALLALLAVLPLAGHYSTGVAITGGVMALHTLWLLTIVLVLALITLRSLVSGGRRGGGREGPPPRYTGR